MLHGNSNPWRKLNHSTWFDSLAILEDPSSNAFLNTVENELSIWKNTLESNKKDIAKWEEKFRTMVHTGIPLDPNYAHEKIQWQTYTIRVQYSYGHRMNVWILDSKNTIQRTHSSLSAFGVDEKSDLYYTLHDIGNGAETLQLSVYKNMGKEPIWTQSPVGPSVVFSDDKILYQTVENQLRYPGIISVAKHTGKNPIKVFEEPDKRFQVELICPPNQFHSFVKIENALSQRLGRIVGTTVQWFTPQIPKDAAGSGTTLIPITKDIYGTNTELIVGKHRVQLPEDEFLSEAMLVNNTILFTTIQLARSALYVYNIQTNETTHIYGKNYPNDIKLRTLSTVPRIEIMTPNKPTHLCEYTDHLYPILTFPEPMKLPFFHHGFAKSKDGTQIPYTIVANTSKPTRLFVEAYGSYGLNSKRSYPITRLAWIDQGYAYAVAFPRGGREDGDRWYDGGRTALRKQNTFDDTAAVIQTLQKKYTIEPNRTLFYGRSAGGLLAANIAHQYPSLVGAVYAEVPYLDVLRTTTNPDLPLTQMEYDEFGDPAKRVSEYIALQKISPVDTVPYAPKNAPFIIVKTALYDSQVLPYETLKWAKKLRMNNWKVFVGIDTNGGHFTDSSNIYRAFAEDAVIITNQLSNRASGNGKSFGKTRSRRRSSRKI